MPIIYGTWSSKWKVWACTTPNGLTCTCGPTSSRTSRRTPASTVSAASRPPLMTCHSPGRFRVGEDSRSTRSSASRIIACTATAEQAKCRVPRALVMNGCGLGIWWALCNMAKPDDPRTQSSRCYLRQRRLGLVQPERPVHGAARVDSCRQRGVGLLLLADRSIQRAEAPVAVGLERAHAEFLGEGEGLVVMGFG